MSAPDSYSHSRSRASQATTAEVGRRLPAKDSFRLFLKLSWAGLPAKDSRRIRAACLEASTSEGLQSRLGRVTAVCLGCLFLLPTPATTQNNDFLSQVIPVRRVEAVIHVDGRLDEPVWQQIEPITRFIQTQPDEGKPATERTEVRIFYTNSRLYFGFTCFDSEPGKIVARLDSHDARTNSDSVDILLDPFGDRRTGYFFSINSRGVQFDALATESAGASGFEIYDGTWDGIWESAAHIEDWGYAVEVAIPFKSIRFAPTNRGDHPWGINLGREIVRKNENDRWVFVTRFDQVMKPSKSGILNGIREVEPGRNLELIPYIAPRFRRGASDREENGNKVEGGFDLRWGITSNLTANLAVNPDFADTEADETNISISRFELFFPEKRKFFTEGANYFKTPFDLFFSRRVGARLPDGVPQRILFGGKLTGKIGKYTIGLLEARTAEQHARDLDNPANPIPLRSPGANFFVLRLQRDIWEKSSIGFITVNRDQKPGDIGSKQRVHAIDLNVLHGPHVSWSSQIAVSRNGAISNDPNRVPTLSGGWQRFAWASGFFYDSNEFSTGLGGTFLGRGFDVSAIGFEPENDRYTGFSFITWKPFIDRGGIRQLFFEWNYDAKNDTFGRIQDAGADFRFRAQFKNFWNFNASYSYDRERFNEFNTDFVALPETRVYITPRVRMELSTNENRPVWFEIEFTKRKTVNFRDNYYGRQEQYEARTNLKLAGRAKLAFNGTYVREFALSGEPLQVRRLFIARYNQQFTPKWRTRVLAQFNNDKLGRNFSINSIVAYDFTARSALYVGYNYQKRRPTALNDLGNEVFVKLSYLFNF